MSDAAGLTHRGVERIDRRAGNAERNIDALHFEDSHSRFGSSHFGHLSISLEIMGELDF